MINNHHFDTSLPTTIDPYNTDPQCSRDHLPYVHFFRLIILYGDILNDLLSIHSVSYSTILAHHAAIDDWLSAFPEELRFDVSNIDTAFVSSDFVRLRLGVQSLCFQLAAQHTRIALVRILTLK